MEVYVFVAMRRKKDNNSLPEKVIKYVSYGNHKEAIDYLTERVTKEEGIWRLYRSVNLRNLDKAQKELTCDIILGKVTNVAKYWESLLMKPESKLEKKWLLDIDNTDQEYFESILSYLLCKKVIIYEETITVNGYHLVCDGFDVRDFKFSDVEIKKDALLFLRLL